jgi:hypothetical protein
LQPFPEFFGHRAGVHTVANEPRLDKDDDSGLGPDARRVSEQVIDKPYLAKTRNTGLRFLIALADKSGEAF